MGEIRQVLLSRKNGKHNFVLALMTIAHDFFFFFFFLWFRTDDFVE